MKIAFSKVRFQEIPFEIEKEGLKFSGTLKSERKNLVKLEAQLDVQMQRICDRCGAEIDDHHVEDLTLLVSEGIYSDSANELDVIESFHDYIDLEEILEGEVNLLKSDYFYCNSCQS